jgi:hypothetical protein
MIVSQTAIEQVVRDIQDGVEYPDFWTNRYEDEQQSEQEATNEQEEKAQD